MVHLTLVIGTYVAVATVDHMNCRDEGDAYERPHRECRNDSARGLIVQCADMKSMDTTRMTKSEQAAMMKKCKGVAGEDKDRSDK